MMPDNKRVLIAIRDITEEKKKQRLLDEYLSMIDEHVITSTTNLDGKILFVSNAFCNVISGYFKRRS